MDSYPGDSDGDALRRVAGGGSDMSRPMAIDYSVHVPDERTGNAVARGVEPLGYRTDLFHDEETGSWSCYCTKEMLATYAGVLAAQDEIEAVAAPLGGHCDGWGTFGNVDAD